MTGRVLGAAAVVLATAMLAAGSAVAVQSDAGGGAARRGVDPDEMGAAFAAGVVRVEEYAEAYDRDEILQLETQVNAWKEHARSHPMAAVGEEQRLHQRLQGISRDPGQQPSSGTQECTGECTCACFCRGACLYSQSVPLDLALFRRSREVEVQGDENLENDAASVFLLLREVALPLLCRDEPLWRLCSRENRLTNTTTFQQVNLRFSGKWGPYARCGKSCELLTCSGVCRHEHCKEPCPAKELMPGRAFLPERYPQPLGTRCRKTDTRFANCQRPWEVWGYMLAQLLREGMLVSLPAAGRCSASDEQIVFPDASTQCSWQLVAAGKRISADCARTRLLSFVENRNSGCFAACLASGQGWHGR